jgi:methionyl aminopeptidase
MLGPADETVGIYFDLQLLEAARDKALQVIQAAALAARPGTTEAELKATVQRIQTDLGATRTWHPPQIRFGNNTILPFGKPSRDGIVLNENDIFFIDIGPVFANHEGDVGRTFIVGDNPDHKRCVEDVEEIWHEVRAHWAQHQVTGPELYAFAAECATRRGWRLALEKANGHRIADFPHAARARGSVEGFTGTPQSHRWILEIQIQDPQMRFGAFYEDLLRPSS